MSFGFSSNDAIRKIRQLDVEAWHGSFNHRESSLQQLAPYVGKLKSGMARVLLEAFSKPGHVVLDPFCGSGVVPLEAVLRGREAWANDLNPYAYVVTRGKLEAPMSLDLAFAKAERLVSRVEELASTVDLRTVPRWVRQFFHPKTLREVIAAVRVLKRERDFFLLSCLMGILHHQRPGFLSYPSSHLVPYLRNHKYPREHFPELYNYRDLRSRLLAKVERAYRKHPVEPTWFRREFKLWCRNAARLPMESASVETIVSSPPYFKALDYGRDNRLRLWFLGHNDWRALDASLAPPQQLYINQMRLCLREMYRVLKHNSYCVLVLGDVERDGRTKRTAEILAELALASTSRGFYVEAIYDDHIPAERRSRRRTSRTRFERILVMRKVRRA